MSRSVLHELESYRCALHKRNISMHPYWITISGHLGVGVTARSEADALQLFALAFGSIEKIVSIEIIKDMNDLDQNHAAPNLGGANWLRRGIWFPQGHEHISN
jgi:hypothetical protein